MTRNYFFYLPLLFFSPSFAQDNGLPAQPRPEATVARMSRAEKIGQLFMVGVYSAPDTHDDDYIEKLVRDYHVGNIICMRGEAQRQKEKTAWLQSIAKEPLLVGMDAEWGPNMRCSDTLALPKQLALGAICDNHLIYDIGKDIGMQCKALGVHLNFAPVVDINDNAQNPIIGMRAFGDNPHHVSLKANAYMHGLHDAGVLACGKHFPGHGDTYVDSHLGLPVLAHSDDYINDHDLYPFKRLIGAGVLAIMPGHLSVPALDPTGTPASLSEPIIRDLLQHRLGFRGLVITDGLYMKALYNTYTLPQMCVKALAAGNDMLLACDSRPLDAKMFAEIVDAIKAIDKAVDAGIISEVDLDHHVEKIIEIKELIGLYDNRYAPDVCEVDEQQTRSLKHNLYADAITLVKNEGILPAGKKVAHVQIGREGETPFSHVLERVCDMPLINAPSDASPIELAMLVNGLEQYETVIVSLFDLSAKPRDNWGITPQMLTILARLRQAHKKVALVLFGNPYALRTLGAEDAILICYDDSIDAQLAAARIIAGLDAPKGALPVTVSTLFCEGTSLSW